VGPADRTEKTQLDMYTQCPECGTAFRVTAEVLRQAAGKVRCGGCGHAFNSLDYLSEQKPGSPPPPQEDEHVGWAPEPPQLEADEPPETISAEHGAEPIETLGELAGPDVRIEDTGSEWRVFGAPEDAGALPAPEDEDAGEIADENESTHWFMDESPTPVDEQLSDEPGDIDEAEIFETARTPANVGEMRFDDDTPLPDDFDFDSEPAESVAAPEEETRIESAEADTARIDLAFGEPEDWEDLLDEVDESEEEYFAASGVPDRDKEEDVEARRAEPLPDVDTQFALQAEALGIDLSGIHARTGQPEAEAVAEPTIDDDLIAAAFEAEAGPGEEDTGTGEPPETLARAGETRDDGEKHDKPGGDRESRDDAEEHDEPGADREVRDDDDEHEEPGGDREIRNDGEGHEEFGDLEVEEPDNLMEARDSELVRNTEEDARLAAELGLHEEDTPERREPAPDIPEQVVPPLTEEEQTVNMMIDQDLLSVAVEDENGFASTIVQKQRPERDDTADPWEREGDRPSARDDESEGPLVETIIMEGEFVRDAFEEERLEAERRRTEDANAEAAAESGTGDNEKETQRVPKERIDSRMVAGIAVLALLLGVQYVHYSRESLAVYPAFNNSVGSVYRMLGQPLVPAWDIAGWRFEATKGSTDESDEVLTIYSRIGNKSGEALPYPLINVSLTDRFEDVIGSKVLEPGDYLAENLDTRDPVPPGETFSAVISIAAPDVNATGFKLNVCYRQPGGRLRCAIDDFK
jgi:predicted Zn finger-like uncharacterized protein